MLIMNVLTEIDDLNPNFGLTIEVLSDFMKFGIKNKWNIRIYLFIAWILGKFHLKIKICSLVIRKT